MNVPAAPRVSSTAAVTLLSLSVALMLLALYQWMELLVVLSGGETVCAVNETVNCGTVWLSDFANHVQGLTGMPVAGLGLVYGSSAFFLSLVATGRSLKGLPGPKVVGALRYTAAVGVLACVTFGVGSLRGGHACPTCLATYALTVAFAVAAYKLLPGPFIPEKGDERGALLLTVAPPVVFFLLLLYPGIRTGAMKTPTRLPPSATANTQQPASPPPSAAPIAAPKNSTLQQFIDGLSAMERQALSDDLKQYAQGVIPMEASQFHPRFITGSQNAPVKITEFTDIRCSHCRALEETLKSLAAAVPQSLWSVEPRHFPLDHECNQVVPSSDGTGTRCMAARAQVCLEGTDYFWRARSQMFDEQETLTKERVLEIASAGPMKKDALLACIKKPETQQKIDEDVRYAMLYQIEGTPLVLVNGREGSPMGPFLYAMLTTRADLLAPELQPLLVAQHP